jgi:hypothetical protein
MRRHQSSVVFPAAVAILGLPVVALAAAPVVDGIVDRSIYGGPVSVQGVRTQFGDNNPSPEPFLTWADGSELDAAYAKISGGNLYLFFSGNLQSNYNKLEIFFDTGAPGQNTIRRDNADVDFNGLGRMGENLDGTNLAKNDTNRPPTDPDQPSNVLGKGLTFDAGFESSHYLTVTCGFDGSVSDFRLFANFATTPADPVATPSTGFFVGSSSAENNRLINGENGVVVASNNSNNRGVLGGDTAPDLTPGNPEDPAAVDTGFEVRVPLSLLGNPTTSPLRISAFINGMSHDFVSNQILGPVVPNPNFGNLGEPRTVDFSTLDGNQFFAVPLLPGDANGNGVIDADDFALFDRGRAKGLTGWSGGDFNGDNVVDGADAAILNAAYSEQQGGAGASGLFAVVPEPASMGVCGLAALSLTARRRRRA